MNKHVVLVGSYVDSLVNFRGDLIRDLVSRGYRVTAMAPSASPMQLDAIEHLGAEFVSYRVQRNGLSLVADLKTLRDLKSHFRALQPDIVIAYTIKPIIWGGLALRSLSKVRFFPLITGLGYAFHGTSLKRRLIRLVATRLYRMALHRADLVFFQNRDNLDLFLKEKLVVGKPTRVVAGSGVNLDRFNYRDWPENGYNFLLVARLIGEKGIREYVAAADQLRALYPDACWRLAGIADSSPDRIKEDEITSWIENGSVEFLGELKDVREAIADCHVYVLPSYHEGMPRTVLEAMATGRAIITTNTSGCRETVSQGVNGYLVEPRDTKELMDRMKWFLENRSKSLEMGFNSRRMVESRFDVRLVNKAMIDAIEAKTP
jgi:glycosyltransferase involved in cell wall biosynthesis